GGALDQLAGPGNAVAQIPGTASGCPAPDNPLFCPWALYATVMAYPYHEPVIHSSYGEPPYMERQVIEKTYRRYAKIYDTCFGRPFEPGRRMAIDKLDCQPGQRIVEVGVGTGLSLPSYPDSVQVVGIDISQDMLNGAQARLRRDGA